MVPQRIAIIGPVHDFGHEDVTCDPPFFFPLPRTGQHSQLSPAHPGMRPIS